MLYIVSTPIGNPKDITLRALETLQQAEFIIGEEQRIASTLLKKLNLSHKTLHLLNEHSTVKDVEALTQLCQGHSVALISDCGTPSFYDPGYQLIQHCRKKNIAITAVPGASSLMTLLSLVSQQVNQFYFAGFLPADTEQRLTAFTTLQTQGEALVLMDTPYRLLKLLKEIEIHFPKRQLLLGLNLTQESELVIEGYPKDIINVLNQRQIEKAEFILIIYKDHQHVHAFHRSAIPSSMTTGSSPKSSHSERTYSQAPSTSSKPKHFSKNSNSKRYSTDGSYPSRSGERSSSSHSSERSESSQTSKRPNGSHSSAWNRPPSKKTTGRRKP